MAEHEIVVFGQHRVDRCDRVADVVLVAAQRAFVPVELRRIGTGDGHAADVVHGRSSWNGRSMPRHPDVRSSSTRTTRPPPARSLNVSEPPCRLTTVCAIARPRPVPPVVRLRDGSSR